MKLKALVRVFVLELVVTGIYILATIITCKLESHSVMLSLLTFCIYNSIYQYQC